MSVRQSEVKIFIFIETITKKTAFVTLAHLTVDMPCLISKLLQKLLFFSKLLVYIIIVCVYLFSDLFIL